MCDLISAFPKSALPWENSCVEQNFGCARGIRPGVDGKSSGKVNIGRDREKGREINARSFFGLQYYGRSDEALRVSPAARLFPWQENRNAF